VECFDEERDPFFWRLSDLSTFVRDGRLHLPERPGFGIVLDTDFVARWTVGRRVTSA
jgi:L-alanine-DL-glutamate epimerase-like enolase superfamily enzyme